MTTALITGITGMVGSHLADYLLEKTDWEIVGLQRWRSPLDNIGHLLERANRGDRLKLVYGDLRDTLSIDKVIADAKPDYVFHLAAQSFPKTSFDAPLDTLDTNIQGLVIKDYQCVLSRWVEGNLVNRNAEIFNGFLRVKIIDRDNDILWQLFVETMY